MSQLAKQQTIEIPPYQRGYVWEAPECARLVNSIAEIALANLSSSKNKQLLQQKYHRMRASSDASLKFHELASWVVSAEGQSYKIVDGQQRLTTLLLMTRALVMTLCRLYNNPHKRNDLREDHEEYLAALLIQKLGKLLTSTISEQNLREWCEFDEAVLVSKALGDEQQAELHQILASGKLYSAVNQEGRFTYANNYRFFLSIFARPTWGLSQAPAKVTTLDYTTTEDGDLSLNFNYGDYDDVGGNGVIANFRKLFYSRIDQNWQEPAYSGEVGGFDLDDTVVGEDVNDGLGIPFLLYFAHTLAFQVRIILHELSSEKTALKYFDVINSTGYVLPREDIFRSRLYRAIIKETNDKSRAGLNKDQANLFIKEWNLWKKQHDAFTVGLPTKDSTFSVLLETVLMYLNVSNQNPEDRNQDRPIPPGDRKQYSINVWPRLFQLGLEHKQKLKDIVEFFNEVSEWFFVNPCHVSSAGEITDLEKEITAQNRIFTLLPNLDDESVDLETRQLAARCRLLVQAYGLLSEANKLAVIYIYLYQAYRNQTNLKQNTHGVGFDLVKFSEFVEKLVANELCRNANYALELTPKSIQQLPLAADIAGCVYVGAQGDKNGLDARVGMFDRYAYRSMAVYSSKAHLTKVNFDEPQTLDRQLETIRTLYSKQVTTDKKAVAEDQGRTKVHFKNHTINFLVMLNTILEVWERFDAQTCIEVGKLNFVHGTKANEFSNQHGNDDQSVPVAWTAKSELGEVTKNKTSKSSKSKRGRKKAPKVVNTEFGNLVISADLDLPLTYNSEQISEAVCGFVEQAFTNFWDKREIKPSIMNE